MLTSLPHPKPKPTKVVRVKRKKNSPLCHCKNFSLNRNDYKTCAKCYKPLRAKDIRKAAEKVLDAVVKEIVLKRDRFCVCPAPEKGHANILQCGHLYSRGKKSVKWDLRNCNCQCSSCNGRHEHFWHYYADWYSREFGEVSRLELSRDSDVTCDLTPDDLETLIRELTAIKARQEVDKDFKPRYSQKQILSGEWRKENGRDTTNNSVQDVYETRA